MPAPLIVCIPHRLGRTEATRRLQAGLRKLRATFAADLGNVEERWSDGHLDFRFDVIEETASGTVDVADDSARLEVWLPPLLATLAAGAKADIERQGRLILAQA